MGKATSPSTTRIAEPTREQLQTGEFDKVGVGHAEGVQTTSLAYVRRQPRSALRYMNEGGSISDDELHAAREIALVVEYLQRSVDSRCASMEARVDCSRSPVAQVNESLRMVRLESAYSEWRAGLPSPMGMVIEMIVKDTGLKDIAKRHHKHWEKTARPMLIEQLQRWTPLAKKYAARIRHEDLIIMHARLSV